MDAYGNPDNMDQAFQEQPVPMEDVYMPEGCGGCEPEQFPGSSEYQEPEYLSEDYASPESEYLTEDSLGEVQSFGAEVFSDGVTIAPLNVAPTVTFPGQNATVPLQTLTIRWNLVANARYIVALRNTVTDALLVPETSLPVGANSLTIAVNRLTPGHQYRFAIASVVGGVTRWASPHRLFRVQNIATPVPTITAPTANARVPRQTLAIRWNAVAGATSYLVSLRNITTNHLYINRRSIALPSVNTSVAITQLLPGHRYRLAVASVFGTVERWSEREFTVEITEADRNRSNPMPGLTGTLRENIVMIARSQIFVRDAGTSQRNPFTRGAAGTDASRHWCGDFAAWVLQQVGRANHVVYNGNVHLNNAPIGSGWNFAWARNWATTPNHGRWNPVAAANVLPGDIVLWQDHIAFVASVSGNNITFVGGNQSRQVDERPPTNRNNPEWGSPRQTFLGYFRVV